MNKEPYKDLIELEATASGGTKLTVSSYHVVELLTYLQEKGFQASGQNPPLFGFDNFPTIYYVNFPAPQTTLAAEVKNYLSGKSLAYEQSEIEESEKNVIRLAL